MSYRQAPSAPFVTPICGECGGDAKAGTVSKIDWILVGGESGPGARLMYLDWARSIRDQCAEAGVPFFFKQHGAWLHETHGAFYPPASWVDREGKPVGDRWHFWTEGDRGGDASCLVGKRRAGRLLDGVTHDATPDRSSSRPAQREAPVHA